MVLMVVLSKYLGAQIHEFLLGVSKKRRPILTETRTPTESEKAGFR